MTNTVSKYPRVKVATFWGKNGKVTRIYPGTKTRRLYAKLRSGNYAKVYFKVEYPMIKSDKGIVRPYNDGEYDNTKDAIQAFKAFLE